jgi:hypothetical protein
MEPPFGGGRRGGRLLPSDSLGHTTARRPRGCSPRPTATLEPAQAADAKGRLSDSAPSAPLDPDAIVVPAGSA